MMTEQIIQDASSRTPSLRTGDDIFASPPGHDGLQYHVRVRVDPARPALCQIDEPPMILLPHLHLYDWVRYQYDDEGRAVFTQIVWASGYKTLHVDFPPHRIQFNIRSALWHHPARRELHRVGLAMHLENDSMRVGVPPSFNPARIDLIERRHPRSALPGGVGMDKLPPLTLTLPWPPSTNRLWKAWRGRMVLSPEARAYKARAAALALTALAPHIQAGLLPYPKTHLVAVSTRYYRPRRVGDTSNYSKIFEDALNGIVWIDDEQIIETHNYRGDDKYSPRIEIVIKVVSIRPPKKTRKKRGTA